MDPYKKEFKPVQRKAAAKLQRSREQDSSQEIEDFNTSLNRSDLSTIIPIQGRTLFRTPDSIPSSSYNTCKQVPNMENTTNQEQQNENNIPPSTSQIRNTESMEEVNLVDTGIIQQSSTGDTQNDHVPLDDNDHAISDGEDDFTRRTENGITQEEQALLPDEEEQRQRHKREEANRRARLRNLIYEPIPTTSQTTGLLQEMTMPQAQNNTNPRYAWSLGGNWNQPFQRTQYRTNTGQQYGFHTGVPINFTY